MTGNSVASFFAVTLLAAAVSLRADPTATQKDLAKESADLRAKVETLQKQNAELNKKIDSLKAEAVRLRSDLEDERESRLARNEGFHFVPANPAPPHLVGPPKSNPIPPRPPQREV